MSDETEILTKEELEEARREEMRELLIEAFDGHSILYEIYQKRGWLDRLFTNRILSMDKEALYMSNQVADIIGTKDHVVKNKRRVLLNYINPIEYGEGNSKIYKHNYISVFKLKMIDGLTGEGAEYTLPQLKELLYGTPAIPNGTKSQEADNDLLVRILRKMEQFEEFEKMVKSGEFFEEIEGRLKQATERLMETNQDAEEINKMALDLYEKILSPDVSLAEKEAEYKKLIELAEKHPAHAFSIKMYSNAAEDRLTRYKQADRELQIRNIKETVLGYYEAFETAKDDTEREKIRIQLNEYADKHPELSYDIRFWLSTAGRERKKKGFWSFLNR